MRIARMPVLPLLMAAVTSHVFTQTPAPPTPAGPTFDVVSIKRNTTGADDRPPDRSPGRQLHHDKHSRDCAHQPGISPDGSERDDWVARVGQDRALRRERHVDAGARDTRRSDRHGPRDARRPLQARRARRETRSAGIRPRPRAQRRQAGTRAHAVGRRLRRESPSAERRRRSGPRPQSTAPPTPTPDLTAPPPSCTLRIVGAVRRGSLASGWATSSKERGRWTIWRRRFVLQ